MRRGEENKKKGNKRMKIMSKIRNKRNEIMRKGKIR